MQVVEDVSSCLGDSSLEMTSHIARNHMDMCRFSAFEDSEYRKVVAALEFIQRRILEGYVDKAPPGLLAPSINWFHVTNQARSGFGTQ